MPERLSTKLKHAWNAFRNRDPTDEMYTYRDLGYGSFTRQDKTRMYITTERSTIISIYNKIAMDVASNTIRHVRLDDEDQYIETIDSGLNYVLSTEANIDQTNTALLQDIVMSMFDEGVVAVVPVDTTSNPNVSGSYDIVTMRTGKIVEWYPQNVKINLYNDLTGQREEIILPKSEVAIIENPLYSVMNEPNGTLKRLIKKLAILDAIDEQSGSGKLDLIIQLPYVIKTQARQDQAEQRRKSIETQLSGSKYGIAYTDGTERITQLNRPVDNNIMNQITYLMTTLYNQLGLTEAVFNGTADPQTMTNYTNGTVVPIVDAIVSEFKRKFLTKTARSQKQSIIYFKNPFKYVPATAIADMSDKFTRNEILTSNEIRSVLGYKRSSKPSADELRNKNLNDPNANNDTESQDSNNPPTDNQEEIDNQNE